MPTSLEKTICSAIQHKRLLSFFYENEERTIEPHVLAYERNETLMLGGWQLFGGTGMGWRNYSVLKITAPTISDREFSQARSVYNRVDPALSTVVCQL